MGNARITDALSALSQQLSRFAQSGASVPRAIPTLEQQRDERIGTLIMEREESFSAAVATKYAQYREPFKTLGEDSIVAKRIAMDERLLLAAYNLYKAAREAEDDIGKGITYIRDANITSPLAVRSEYTNGDEFVYLRAYLMYEQLVTDLVPQFEMERDGSFYLTFVPASAVHQTFKQKEILAAIKASYKVENSDKSDNSRNVL